MYLDAKLPSPDVVASVKECAIKSQAGVLPPTSVLAVAAPQQGNLIKMLFVGIQQLIQALICLGRNIRIAVITPSRCDRNDSLFAKEKGPYVPPFAGFTARNSFNEAFSYQWNSRHSTIATLFSCFPWMVA